MKQSLRDILVTHPTEFGGLILQALSAGWGGWVAWPWLDTFKSARSYDGLASVMDETVWGLVVLGIALWNLWLMRVGSRRWRSVGWFLAGFNKAPSGNMTLRADLFRRS